MNTQDISWQLKCILWLSRHSEPLWRWALGRRLRRNKETKVSFDQKLMLHSPSIARQQGARPRYVWGHAVGVGEVLALLGLFRRLSVDFPEYHFLLTSTTITSQQALLQQNLGPRFVHQFAPIDHPQFIALFLDTWQPALACWSESDLWPCMLLTTRKRHIPMFLFNARMSASKQNRTRQLQWFYQPLLQSFDSIYAQNQESHRSLSQLGFHLTIADITGNIKALAPALSYDMNECERLKSLLQSRPVWVLASSHEGEEETACVAHQMLRTVASNALLIIVPRNIARGAQISQIAQHKGLTAVLRTVKSHDIAACDVYVADSFGELGLWYALSPVALIGGSLVRVGGHNPYEALAANCKVLSGPHVHNFSESYSQLDTLGMATIVSDADSIFRSILHAWSLPAHHCTSVLPVQQLYQDVVLKLKSALSPSSVQPNLLH